jgi:hypothetical protein
VCCYIFVAMVVAVIVIIVSICCRYYYSCCGLLFQVNGVPIPVKGSNWIPADAFENRVVTGGLFQKAIHIYCSVIFFFKKPGLPDHLAPTHLRGTAGLLPEHGPQLGAVGILLLLLYVLRASTESF